MRSDGAPTLESERIVLRPWRDDDIEAFVRISFDPRVMEFLVQRSAEQMREVAERCRSMLERDGYGSWVLEIKDVAPFAGTIALQNVPFEAAFTPAMEVGWRLAAAHWGRGYATEGARLALRFAFDVLHQEEVVALTVPANLRSQRVMERLGMTRDPRDDFDHPRLPEGHPLRRHVLYRLARNDAG
ncbi:MAG: GNAT family N-acetyltransferase [Candidatus Eremiobacteraeota bacterium]|nr:GNAT family N-acetyltransferase [Candidatus Eremiobacteraeota bacterium]